MFSISSEVSWFFTLFKLYYEYWTNSHRKLNEFSNFQIFCMNIIKYHNELLCDFCSHCTWLSLVKLGSKSHYKSSHICWYYFPHFDLPAFTGCLFLYPISLQPFSSCIHCHYWTKNENSEFVVSSLPVWQLPALFNDFYRVVLHRSLVPPYLQFICT